MTTLPNLPFKVFFIITLILSSCVPHMTSASPALHSNIYFPESEEDLPEANKSEPETEDRLEEDHEASGSITPAELVEALALPTNISHQKPLEGTSFLLLVPPRFSCSPCKKFHTRLQRCLRISGCQVYETSQGEHKIRFGAPLAL